MGLMEDFAKKLVEISQYPKLNAIILAQAMLETGRFTSPLAKEHFNFFGMKWRDELTGLATAVTLPVTSEESGFGTFCHFPTIENGVKGYFKFITRAPYKGWEEFKEDDAGYIRFIAKCGWAADHNYADKVLMLLPEAEKFLKAILPSQPSPASYWAELYPKTGNLYLIEEPGSRAIKVWETRKETARLSQALTEVRFLAGMVAFAPVDKGEPAIVDPLPEPEKPKPNGITITLDAGHSERNVGARSNNKVVEEEDLNRKQVEIIIQRLGAKGFTVKFWDPIDDDIYAIGKAAKGSHMFISCHLNSYDGNEDVYSCCMVHSTRRSADDNKFASLVARKIAKAIGNKLFQASGELPGVYPANLGVLRGAADANVPIKILTEAFFLNPYKDMETAGVRAVKAAHAIADAVIEWYGVS